MSKKLIILGLMVINFSIKSNAHRTEAKDHAKRFVHEYKKTATDSGVVYPYVGDKSCIVEITISEERPDDGHLCPGYCEAKGFDFEAKCVETMPSLCSFHMKGDVLTCYCYNND